MMSSSKESSIIRQLRTHLNYFNLSGDADALVTAATVLESDRRQAAVVDDGIVSELRKKLAIQQDDLAEQYRKLTALRYALERRCKMIRAALVQVCIAKGGSTVSLANGMGYGKRIVRLSLPKMYTAERRDLVDYLKAAGVFERSITLSSPRIKSLINGGSIDRRDPVMQQLSSLRDSYEIRIPQPFIADETAAKKIAAEVFGFPSD